MVDPEREVPQCISQPPGKQLELRRPLRTVLNYGNLTALIVKRHIATRYIPGERLDRWLERYEQDHDLRLEY
ncbi:hypothetical protein [Actinacidiphila oryziradicis]|uniref:hypothetical protein n=1 Tax=Actinacidiphila oryziradicis TaxID=2571141 RepID=UPI001FEC2C14|nr:hypothetical protein [Actinacidiphila oryziradicis]